MSTFYVPLVIILLLYWKIFMTARTRLRKRLAAKAQVNFGSNKNSSNTNKTVEKKCPIVVELNEGKTTTRIDSVVLEGVNEEEADEVKDHVEAVTRSKFISQGCQTDRSGTGSHLHGGQNT
jgi:hypothetical protein